MPPTDHSPSTSAAARLCREWDAMHRHYFPDYDQRWDRALRAAHAHLNGRPGRVLDLGCGPGTLTRRLQQAVPQAEVIGLDADPVLIALARAQATSGRPTFARARLGAPEASALLAGLAPIDVIVSSAFVHYFAPDELTALLRACRALQPPDGLLVTVERFAATDAPRTTRAPTTPSPWRAWWRDALATPEILALPGGSDPTAVPGATDRSAPPLTLSGYLAALAASGYRHPRELPGDGPSSVVVGRAG